MNKGNLNALKGTRQTPRSPERDRVIANTDKQNDLIEKYEKMQGLIKNEKNTPKIKEPQRRIADAKKLTIPRRLANSKGPIIYPNKQTTIAHLINNNENLLSRLKFTGDADMFPERQNQIQSSANSCAEPDSSSEYSQSEKSIKSAVTDTYLTHKDKQETLSREKLSQYLLERNFEAMPRNEKHMEIIFKSKDIIHNFLNSMQNLQKAVTYRNDNVEKIKRDFEVSKTKLSELVNELKDVIDFEFAEDNRSRELSLASKDSYSKKSEQEEGAEKAEQQLHEIEERLKEEYKRISKDSQSWKEKQKKIEEANIGQKISPENEENDKIQQVENENEECKRKIGELEEAIKTQKHTIQKLNERNEKQEKMINEYKEIVSKYEKKVKELQKNSIKIKRNQPPKILIGEEIKRKFEMLLNKQIEGLIRKFEFWIEENTEKVLILKNKVIDILNKKSKEHNELNKKLNKTENLLQISNENAIQNELALKAKLNIIDEMQKTLKKNFNENASLRLNLSREEEEKQNLLHFLREQASKFHLFSGKQLKLFKEKEIILNAKLESCVKSVNLVKLAHIEAEERRKTASLEQTTIIHEQIKELNAQIGKAKGETNRVQKEISIKIEQIAGLNKKLDAKENQSKKFEELAKIKQSELVGYKTLLSNNLTTVVNEIIKSMNPKINIVAFTSRFQNIFNICKKALQGKNDTINELNKQIREKEEQIYNFKIEQQKCEVKLVEMQKINQNTGLKLQNDLRKIYIAKINECKDLMTKHLALIISKEFKNLNEAISNNTLQTRLDAITKSITILTLERNDKINELNKKISSLDIEKRNNELKFSEIQKTYTNKEINLKLQYESEINTIKKSMQINLEDIQNSNKMQKGVVKTLLISAFKKFQEEKMKDLMNIIEPVFALVDQFRNKFEEFKGKSRQKVEIWESEQRSLNKQIMEKEIINQNIIKENIKLTEKEKELNKKILQLTVKDYRNENITNLVNKSFKKYVDNQKMATETLQNTISIGINMQMSLINKIELLLCANKKLKRELDILSEDKMNLKEEKQINMQKQQKAVNSILQFKRTMKELFEIQTNKIENSMEKISKSIIGIEYLNKKINYTLEEKDKKILNLNLSLSDIKTEMINKSIQQRKLIEEIIKKHNDIAINKNFYYSIDIHIGNQNEKLKSLAILINELKEKTKDKKESYIKICNLFKKVCKDIKIENTIKHFEEKKNEIAEKINLFNGKIQKIKLIYSQTTSEQRSAFENKLNHERQKVEEIIKNYKEATQQFYFIQNEKLGMQNAKFQKLIKVFNDMKLKSQSQNSIRRKALCRIKNASSEKAKNLIQGFERIKAVTEEKCKLFNLKIMKLNSTIERVVTTKTRSLELNVYTKQIQQRKIIEGIMKNYFCSNQSLFSSIFNNFEKQNLKMQNLENAFRGIKANFITQKESHTKLFDQIKKDNSIRLEKFVHSIDDKKRELEAKCQLFTCTIGKLSISFAKLYSNQRDALIKASNMNIKLKEIIKKYELLYSSTYNNLCKQNGKVEKLEKAINKLKENIKIKRNQFKKITSIRIENIIQQFKEYNKEIEGKCQLFENTLVKINKTYTKTLEKKLNSEKENLKIIQKKFEIVQSDLSTQNLILIEKENFIKNKNILLSKMSEKIKEMACNSVYKSEPNLEIPKTFLHFFDKINDLNQKINKANNLFKQKQENFTSKIVEAKNSKASFKEIQNYIVQIEKKDQMLVEVRNIADQENKKLNQEKIKIKRKMNDFKEIVNSSLLQWCNSVATKVNVVSSQLTIYGSRLRRAVTKRNSLAKKYKSKVIECNEKKTLIITYNQNKIKTKLDCRIEQIHNLSIQSTLSKNYLINWIEQVNKMKKFEEAITSNCKMNEMKIISCMKRAQNYCIKKYTSCTICPLVYPMTIINASKKEVEPKAKLKYLVKQIAEQIPLE